MPRFWWKHPGPVVPVGEHPLVRPAVLDDVPQSERLQDSQHCAAVAGSPPRSAAPGGPGRRRRPRPGRGPDRGPGRWWRCSPDPPLGAPHPRSGPGRPGHGRRSTGRSWTAPTGAARWRVPRPGPAARQPTGPRAPGPRPAHRCRARSATPAIPADPRHRPAWFAASAGWSATPPPAAPPAPPARPPWGRHREGLAAAEEPSACTGSDEERYRNPPLSTGRRAVR